MKKSESKVTPNPWGDPRAVISVTPKYGRPAKPATSGPAENPPTPGAPTRQRYKMAGGK